jgi:hypothetical protein
VFAELQGSYASYTSRTNAGESCEAPNAGTHLCDADGSSGEVSRVSAFAGTFPVPPGWSVALTFNGAPVCQTNDIEGRCEGEVTFPTVSATSTVELTATLSSPHGATLVATRLITIFP